MTDQIIAKSHDPGESRHRWAGRWGGGGGGGEVIKSKGLLSSVLLLPKVASLMSQKMHEIVSAAIAQLGVSNQAINTRAENILTSL